MRATRDGATVVSHDEQLDLLTTDAVFETATLGAARALGREDLGRIAAGAKADLALVDLRHPSMRPVRDPLKCLVYSGAAAAVRDVFVGGEFVVSDGAVLTIDQDDALDRLDDALDRLQEGQKRALDRIPELDWAKRSADEISPFCLPID